MLTLKVSLLLTLLGVSFYGVPLVIGIILEKKELIKLISGFLIVHFLITTILTFTALTQVTPIEEESIYTETPYVELGEFNEGIL